jgi:hypothetical protein
VFERTLGLCAPELVGGNIYFAEAIGFFASAWRLRFSGFDFVF